MRNLFGWSSPPKRKDRKYSRLRAKALQDLIKAKAAHQIWVDIEEHGDGYVIPLSLLNVLADQDGTMASISNYQLAQDVPAAATDALITVPSNEIWEIGLLLMSMNCDSNIANRVITIEVRENLPVAVTAGSPERSWLSVASTLTADQDGQIHVPRGTHMVNNDNGAITNTNRTLNPLICGGGCEIHGLATNKQAGDYLGLYVYYKVVGNI